MSTEDIYHWRAIIALSEAEMPDADPRPLATWARGLMAEWPPEDYDSPRPYEHVGVIVAATGAVLTRTKQHPKDSRLYDVLLDGQPVDLLTGINELRRRTGATVAHVRGVEVCIGAVPLHLRRPQP